MLLSMRKYPALLWGLSVLFLVESDSVTWSASQRPTPTQVAATIATPQTESKDAIAVNINGSSDSTVTVGATPSSSEPQIPHSTDPPASGGATPPIDMTAPGTVKAPGNQQSQNTSHATFISPPTAGASTQTPTVIVPKQNSDLNPTLSPPARTNQTTHDVFSTVSPPVSDPNKQSSSQDRESGASNTSSSTSSANLGTTIAPGNLPTSKSTNSSLVMDPSHPGTTMSPRNISTSDSTNSSVLMDSSNPGTTMSPGNISTSESTNSSMVMDSSSSGTTMSPRNISTSESTNSSVVMDSSNSSTTISPSNVTTSESTNSSIFVDSSNSGTTISPRNISTPTSTSSTIPKDLSNSTSSNSSILIPPEANTPAIRPNPATTTAPRQQSPNTNVQSCNTRTLVKQSLIVIAILAALVTIFMVSTIALCVKLSTTRYKVRKSQQGTEMICISSLLPESRYNYTRQRNPPRNGVRVIHTQDDSDDEVSDNFTLSSFLPDNDRYV